LIFSDIHGDTRALETLVAQPADIYIAAGDLSTLAKTSTRCGEIMKPLGERVWVPARKSRKPRRYAQLLRTLRILRLSSPDPRAEIRTWHHAMGRPGLQHITPFNTPVNTQKTKSRKRWLHSITRSHYISSSTFHPKALASTNSPAGKHAGSPRSANGWIASNRSTFSAATSRMRWPQRSSRCNASFQRREKGLHSRSIDTSRVFALCLGAFCCGKRRSGETISCSCYLQDKSQAVDDPRSLRSSSVLRPRHSIPGESIAGPVPTSD